MSKVRDARPPIYVDDEGEVRLIRQEKGERLNFLFSQLQQARAQEAPQEAIRAASDELFAEVLDYCGVVLRKEANRRMWNLPGCDPADDDMRMDTDYRQDGEAAPRLSQLLDDDFRQTAAAKIFFNLDSSSGKNKAGKPCAFHTWAYKIIASVIMDAVRERMKNRTSALSSNKASKADAVGTTSGAGGARMTRNRQEDRTINQIDQPYAEPGPRFSAAEAHAKAEAINALYRQQSVKDRRFLMLKWDAVRDGLRLSDRSIAVLLNWPVKKVYNRAAKFKKMGLLAPKSAEPQKRVYNRTARAKLAKSKTAGLSSAQKT
jgi:hypothetical protein